MGQVSPKRKEYFDDIISEELSLNYNKTQKQPKVIAV